MQFQHIDRSDPEKAYAAVRNISGATQSIGAAVFYDPATADGLSVSQGTVANKWLFAGILPAALSDSSYGRAQVYGQCSAYMVLNSTAVSAVAGDQLDAVTSAAYLRPYQKSDYFLSGALSGAYAVGNIWNYVTLLDTFASAASTQSTPALHSVFVRAL
jgi:hypothetical protein